MPDEFVKILQQPRRTGFRDAFLRGAPFVQITDLADPILTEGDETTVAGRDIAGVRNEAGNVFGLMPHPEHAVDPLTGSSDGLTIFESMRAHVEQHVLA